MRKYRVTAGVLSAAVVIVAVADARGQTPASGAASLVEAGAQVTNTGLLMGVVVDSRDGRPVPEARVSLGASNSPDVDVLADDEGRFVFADLAAGRYTVVVAEAGYAEGAYGRRRPDGPSQTLVLAEGDRIGNLRIPLWKTGSITGTVTDGSGEPLVDVAVRLFARAIVAGRSRLIPRPLARTDDRGIYRFGSLVPGNYVVAVPSVQATAPGSVVDECRRTPARGPMPTCDLATNLGAAGGDVLNALVRAGGTRVGAWSLQSLSGLAPVVSPNGRLSVYPATYYPGAATAADASTITIGAGDEQSGVDVRMQLVSTWSVSGTVTGPDGPLVIGVSLTPDRDRDNVQQSAGLETAETMSDAAGQFTFLGVPEGRYLLRAMKIPPEPARGAPLLPPSASTLSASEPVVVAAADVRDVAIALQRGFRVSGRVVAEDAAAQIPADVLTRLMVLLDSADGQPPPSPILGRMFIDASGQISSAELPSGRYLLRVNAPDGLVLKNALVDGRDISSVPFALDHDLSGVTVTLTRHPSELDGRVEAVAGDADAAVDVLIFPADPTAWVDTGVNSRRVRAIRVDAEGGYRAIGLPAGAYLVAAVPDESAANWRDPAVLSRLARIATAVTVAEGQTRSLMLRTANVPQ